MRVRRIHCEGHLLNAMTLLAMYLIQSSVSGVKARGCNNSIQFVSHARCVIPDALVCGMVSGIIPRTSKEPEGRQ